MNWNWIAFEQYISAFCSSKQRYQKTVTTRGILMKFSDSSVCLISQRERYGTQIPSQKYSELYYGSVVAINFFLYFIDVFAGGPVC